MLGLIKKNEEEITRRRRGRPSQAEGTVQRPRGREALRGTRVAEGEGRG